jgi:hypothetical protein
MGATRCRKHGLQAGPICCDHVIAALDADGSPMREGDFVDFKVDCLADGSWLVPITACADCLRKLAISPGAIFSHGILTAPEFPDEVAPCCGKCFATWRARLSLA